MTSPPVLFASSKPSRTAWVRSRGIVLTSLWPDAEIQDLRLKTCSSNIYIVMSFQWKQNSGTFRCVAAPTGSSAFAAYNSMDREWIGIYQGLPNMWKIYVQSFHWTVLPRVSHATNHFSTSLFWENSREKQTVHYNLEISYCVSVSQVVQPWQWAPVSILPPP